MTRDITTYFSDSRDDDASAVNVDSTRVSITNEEGAHLSMEWDQWDRLVAEVTKLRPLVTREAA